MEATLKLSSLYSGCIVLAAHSAVVLVEHHLGFAIHGFVVHLPSLVAACSADGLWMKMQLVMSFDYGDDYWNVTAEFLVNDVHPDCHDFPISTSCSTMSPLARLP